MSKNNLVHIRYIIDTAFPIFTENYEADEDDQLLFIKKQIIALYRIRHNPKKDFFAFFNYLKKIISINQRLDFFDEFYNFLNYKYKVNPKQKLQWFLDCNNYTKYSIDKISLIASEKQIFFSLPNNKNFLSIILFFLYDHYTVHTFCNYNPYFFLPKEEQELLSLFRKLPTNLRHRTVSYTKKLVELPQKENLDFAQEKKSLCKHDQKNIF